MAAFVLNPFQRVIGIHFPDDGGPDRSGFAYAIFEAWSSTRDWAWPFLARMMHPEGLAARWNWSELGGVRGPYIVGSTSPQTGLGGDYAYAEHRRKDPPEGPAFSDDMDAILLPSDEEWFLWHVGNNFRAAGERQYCIVNMRKIFAEYGTEAEPQPMCRLGIGGLGAGDGNVNYRLRIHSGVDPATFSFASDGSLSCSLPQADLQEGYLGPSIVYGLELIF